MPITHHVDRVKNILFIVRSGSISSQDEQTALRKRQVESLIVPGIAVLVDCRGIDPPDNTDTVRYMAEKDIELASELQCGPVAIVVSSKAQLGMARMYQILTELTHQDTEIFQDYDAALRWIEKRRSGPGRS